ncbi:hypothetical protein AVEN_207991-1 [Araneus ventricosus]|uniref:Uncharacterized protein n=1 Tax=Araneus ventricosus TaxID=182803 RepID=A0A4Y2J8E6_ARAVE|nr:hypothetical protein AVEN_207991-1 [Araneus ventricosus]
MGEMFHPAATNSKFGLCDQRVTASITRSTCDNSSHRSMTSHNKRWAANLPFRNLNRASFNSKVNQFITGHGLLVTYLHKFCLCSHDRCVCGDAGDPNHYATDCPVTKPFISHSPVLKTFQHGVKILSKTKDPWHDHEYDEYPS